MIGPMYLILSTEIDTLRYNKVAISHVKCEKMLRNFIFVYSFLSFDCYCGSYNAASISYTLFFPFNTSIIPATNEYCSKSIKAKQTFRSYKRAYVGRKKKQQLLSYRIPTNTTWQLNVKLIWYVFQTKIHYYTYMRKVKNVFFFPNK